MLSRSYWLRGPTPFRDILDMLAEGRDIAQQLGDIEIGAEAIQWRIASLLAIGDLTAARVELAALLDMAGRMRQPFAMHVAEQYAAAIALCDGRLREAEAAAERSREWSRLSAGRDPSSVYGIQMFGIRREQGRLAELAPAVRSLAASDRAAAWRPGLAALMAELGMVQEARAELDRVRADGLDTLRPALWLASLTYLADVCSIVGDAEMARLVYAELLPHSGSSVMIGHAVASYGAADRYLGMLAAAFGDRALAARHFEAGLVLDREAGAHTWVAHTAFEYGRLLHAGGAAEDAGRAAELLAEAAELATRIGMRALLERMHAPGAPVMAPSGLSPRRLISCASWPAALEPRRRPGALDQRAHRRQPHPQHPAKDRRREPHRGGGVRTRQRAGRGVASSNAARHRRTQLRRPARSDGRGRPPHRRGQLRGGTTWLFSFLSADRSGRTASTRRRPRGDPGRGEAQQHPGRRDRRGQPAHAEPRAVGG